MKEWECNQFCHNIVNSFRLLQPNIQHNVLKFIPYFQCKQVSALVLKNFREMGLLLVNKLVSQNDLVSPLHSVIPKTKSTRRTSIGLQDLIRKMAETALSLPWPLRHLALDFHTVFHCPPLCTIHTWEKSLWLRFYYYYKIIFFNVFSCHLNCVYFFI